MCTHYCQSKSFQRTYAFWMGSFSGYSLTILNKYFFQSITHYFEWKKFFKELTYYFEWQTFCKALIHYFELENFSKHSQNGKIFQSPHALFSKGNFFQKDQTLLNGKFFSALTNYLEWTLFSILTHYFEWKTCFKTLTYQIHAIYYKHGNYANFS